MLSCAVLGHAVLCCVVLCCQVLEEVGSPSTFTDLRFSNDGKYILGVVENKVGQKCALQGSQLCLHWCWEQPAHQREEGETEDGPPGSFLYFRLGGVLHFPVPGAFALSDRG